MHDVAFVSSFLSPNPIQTMDRALLFRLKTFVVAVVVVVVGFCFLPNSIVACRPVIGVISPKLVCTSIHTQER